MSRTTCEGASSQRPRRPPRKYKVRRIWRLELACGHTAFGVATEPSTKGVARFCYACDRYAMISDVLELIFKTSDKASRIPIKHHEPDGTIDAD